MSDCIASCKHELSDCIKYSQLRYTATAMPKIQLNAFKSMFLIRISNNLLMYKIDQINQISILSFYFFHFLPQSISARSFLPFFFRNIFPHYLFITCCFRRRSSAKVPNFPLWPLTTAKRAAILKKKAKSNSHWSVTITSETANLDQSECRKINSHLEIYTN